MMDTIIEECVMAMMDACTYMTPMGLRLRDSQTCNTILDIAYFFIIDDIDIVFC